MPQPEFEHLGYFKEYYIGHKLIGQKRCELDREQTGYPGRVTEVLQETVTMENGKKIKAGAEVMTIIYPMCGKVTAR